MTCRAAVVCADVTARYPKLSGTGYIAFPVLRGAHRELHVIVELRPDVLDGLVLFSAGHPDAQSDFFSLSLQRGRVELRYVRRVHSGGTMRWAGWTKSRGPRVQGGGKKIKNNFPVTVKIRTSGYQPPECFTATLPT